MTQTRLQLDDPRLQRALEQLAPLARTTIQAAVEKANRLHADQVTPEHLLTALLADEEAAATRLVLHAFADPETIAAEVLALCPGIMVVGSKRTLPFSTLGVRALEGARVLAHEASATTIDGEHLLRSALGQLAAEQRSALDAAGLRTATGASDAAPTNAEVVPLGGQLLRHFSNRARRSMSAAAKVAGTLGRDAIAPAHLMISCLDLDPALPQVWGVSAQRVRHALRGQDADETPLSRRALSPDPDLARLLGELPPRSDTMGILGWLLTNGTPELRLLLERQKVTPELFAHAAPSFSDPA